MDTEGHWVDALFAAVDRMDHVAFADLLAPDALFRYGNSAPVHGRAAIKDIVADFFSALQGLNDRIEDRWILPDTVIVTGTVTYTRHDGSTLQVPFANILRLRDSRIFQYLIFVDNSALFAD